MKNLNYSTMELLCNCKPNDMLAALKFYTAARRGSEYDFRCRYNLAIDSVEEGKILMITIDFQEDGYTIRIDKAVGNLNLN